MNKTIVVSIVVILIVIIGGYFIFTTNQGSSYKAPVIDTTTNQPNVNTPATTTNTQPTQPEKLNASVSIKNFAFNPTPLTVKVGTTVTWTNNDTVPHKIKSSTFNSETLSNGQSYAFTFSAVGEYNYSCAIHPSMLGKIIVTQ